MDSFSRNIGTTPGASEPQGSAVVGGSGVKAGSNVAGPLRSSSHDRESTGVASQAPVTLPATRAEEEDRYVELGPFSCIDEVEAVSIKVKKLAARLKAFCDANRNVHQPIKAMAVEFKEMVEGFVPALAGLRRSTAAVDREVSDLSTSIRLREFNDSMMRGTSSPKKKKGVSTASQTEAPEVAAPTRAKIVEVKEKKQQEEEQAVVSGKDRKPKKKKKKTVKRIKDDKIRVTHAQGITISKGVGVSTYSEMVKRLKDVVDLEAIGVQVQAARRTKDDGLFLLVGKGARAAEGAKKLKEAAEEALGAEAIVKDSSRPCTIEIRGISENDNEEDVVVGVCRYGADPREVTVRKLEPSWGGSQRALVAVNVATAEKIIAGGRVLVGLVSCRARLKRDPATRCFRCHGYGHKARSCRGPDRSKLCMTCGGEDHVAKQCRAPPNCVLCKEIKRPADHFPGSGKCEAHRKSKSR